jgi:catechol 2,3-dioxygenase-like lactoylglutathione lyase family enzyme
MTRNAPPLSGILETAIYSDDLERTDRFYGGLLGLKRVFASARMLT